MVETVEIGTTGDSPAGIDIGATIAGALPSGLQDSLTDLRRGQSRETDRITKTLDQDIDADQDRIHRWHAATEASGIEAAQYPKWNEDEQQKKFSHDPIEAFGSLGSVVGILASAFTHAPMENAFNASAAAMNAIKAGDDQAYDRAHKAWKENLDLVYKRHDLMRSEYQDATTLMATDMKAGEAKLKTSAIRFGDKRLLALSEAGMDKEMFEYLDAQNKAITQMRQIKLDGMEDTMKAKAYDGIAKGIDDAAKQAQAGGGQVDPTEIAGRKLQAFNRIYKAAKETPQQQIMGTFFAQHPLATAEEAAKFATENGVIAHPRFNTDEEIIRTLEEERAAAGMPSPTAAEKADAVQKAKRAAGTGTGVVTGAREMAQEVKKYKEGLAAEKNDDGSPKYTQNQIADMGAKREAELKRASAAPSGNRIDDMKRREDQLETAIQHIDKASNLLKKHNAISGIGGSVLRRGETVISMMGSKSTDWHEFESEVATIKQLEPRLLLDATGRPLAGEQDLREKIVRGLGAGDTKNITAERFIQLRRDFLDALERTRKRRMGGDTNPDSPAKPSDSGGKKPWEGDPVVKPRAEIDSDEMTV